MNIENKAISNVEIEDICRQYYVPLNEVCMKDELTSLEIGNYIINLQNRDQGGSHWTAIIIRRNQVFYFDSFGAVCPQDTHNLLMKYFPKIYFNNFIVQNLGSNLCGYYCIGLLMYLKLHEKPNSDVLKICNDYVNLFYDDTKQNDTVLRKFINSYCSKMKKKH